MFYIAKCAIFRLLWYNIVDFLKIFGGHSMKHVCELSYQFLITHLPNGMNEEKLQAYFIGDNCTVPI